MTLNNKSFSDSRSLNDKIKALIGLPSKIGEPNCNKGLRLIRPCYLLSKHEILTDSGQCSFFMANPSESLGFKTKADLHTWQNSLQTSIKNTSVTAKNTSSEDIPLHSGWVGVYPYPNQVTSLDQIDSNLAEFHYYPWVICLEHSTGIFYLLGSPDEAAEQAFQTLQSQPDHNAPDNNNALDPNYFKSDKFAPSWSKADYDKAFYKIQDYLEAGDCYQVNLTQPHKAHYKGRALDTLLPLYTSLNPSFGCYFEGQDFQLVSISPERLMSVDSSGKLEAKPIKGTIKRSSDPKQDQILIDELLSSKKNQAENLMIVDLLRNDLSMSAEPNSVKVEKLFDLETHPNVHHLVSTISAQLKTNLNPAQAIENVFPGGSITGAPKKRAMEIIEELEAQPRSLYCGSFGYYSDSGNADFNILIRSLEFRDNTITCWGGGGITIDSDCDEEYEESLTKVRRIMDVVENTGGASH